MGQHEYGVDLAAKPDEMKRVSLAFRAGEQKERDRILSKLREMGEKEIATEHLGALTWTGKLIQELELEAPVVQ